MALNIPADELENFQSKIKIFYGFWNVDHCRNNPGCLFVFGDNDIKRGLGGQAVIRNEPNAIGIPTKKFPTNDPNAFYTDSEYLKNIEKIDTAVRELIVESNAYNIVYMPENGFGAGLARLNETAPETYVYMQWLQTNILLIPPK